MWLLADKTNALQNFCKRNRSEGKMKAYQKSLSEEKKMENQAG
jgi:hypothetical protein